METPFKEVGCNPSNNSSIILIERSKQTCQSNIPIEHSNRTFHRTFKSIIASHIPSEHSNRTFHRTFQSNILTEHSNRTFLSNISTEHLNRTFHRTFHRTFPSRLAISRSCILRNQLHVPCCMRAACRMYDAFRLHAVHCICCMLRCQVAHVFADDRAAGNFGKAAGRAHTLFFHASHLLGERRRRQTPEGLKHARVATLGTRGGRQEKKGH